MKCESKTSLAHFHCSWAVGIFCYGAISCNTRYACHWNPYVLNLIFVEVSYAINDSPRYGAAEIDQLMHDKRQDARGQNIILHVCIPRRPQALEDVEVNIVSGDIVELTPIGILGC